MRRLFSLFLLLALTAHAVSGGAMLLVLAVAHQEAVRDALRGGREEVLLAEACGGAACPSTAQKGADCENRPVAVRLPGTSELVYVAVWREDTDRTTSCGGIAPQLRQAALAPGVFFSDAPSAEAALQAESQVTLPMQLGRLLSPPRLPSIPPPRAGLFA